MDIDLHAPMDIFSFLALLEHKILANPHRRSQDFVRGALISGKKGNELFQSSPSKDGLKLLSK